MRREVIADGGASDNQHIQRHPENIHNRRLQLVCKEVQCVSIRQHTSAYVSIRRRTSAYVSIRQHTYALRGCLHSFLRLPPRFVSICTLVPVKQVSICTVVEGCCRSLLRLPPRFVSNCTFVPVKKVSICTVVPVQILTFAYNSTSTDFCSALAVPQVFVQQ